MGVYKSLSQGGGFTLPTLVKLTSESGDDAVYLINDNEDLTYEGITYKASNFSYTPSDNSESTLEVEIVESDKIIDILENSYHFQAEFTEIFYDGEIEAFSTRKHYYGEATWDGLKLELSIERDDRWDMTFPALIFNNYNNRGNT